MIKTDYVKRRLKLIIKCIIRDMSDPFYLNVAPSLAYYFLLSIAPVLLLLSYPAGLIFQNSDVISELITEYLPSELSGVILNLITSQSMTSGLVTTIVFLIFTLYLASRGLYVLIKISDYASDNLEAATLRDIPAAFMKRHLKALILTLMMIAIVTFSLVGLVFGRVALDIAANVAEFNGVWKFLSSVYEIITYPIGLAVIFLIMILFYALMPTKRLSIPDVVPGAAVSSLGMVLASIGFVIYIKFFFRTNAIYGALTSIVVLILWFFLIAHVLVFGIIVNHAFKDTRPLR